MWMQYAAEGWVKATDIDTSVERLGCELYALSMDSLHAANYDLDCCFDSDNVQCLLKDSEKYSSGSNLCQKYLHGILTIEEFCEQITEIELKRFLCDLRQYLPKEIIEKYQLDQDTQENDGEEENVGEDVCD